MATTVPSPLPPAGNPPAAALSDVEKLILQDLLSERAKLRESIRDSVRYMGIALAVLIGFMVNRLVQNAQVQNAQVQNAPSASSLPAKPASQSSPGLSFLAEYYLTYRGAVIVWLAFSLVYGFARRIKWLRGSLATTTQLINKRIGPRAENVNDGDMVAGNMFWRLGDGVVFVLLFVFILNQIAHWVFRG